MLEHMSKTNLGFISTLRNQWSLEAPPNLI